MLKAAAFFGVMMTAQAVLAAEIRVLSAGAIEPGLRAAAQAFEKSTEREVRITFNTAPQKAAFAAAGID